MLLAVYAISIKKPKGKRLYSSFHLRSNGILSDSTHIRSIMSISLISWRSPLKHLSRCTPIWRLFSVFLHNLEGNDVTWKHSIASVCHWLLLASLVPRPLPPLTVLKARENGWAWEWINESRWTRDGQGCLYSLDSVDRAYIGYAPNLKQFFLHKPKRLERAKFSYHMSLGLLISHQISSFPIDRDRLSFCYMQTSQTASKPINSVVVTIATWLSLDKDRVTQIYTCRGTFKSVYKQKTGKQ